MIGRELAQTLTYNPFKVAAYLAELHKNQAEKKLNLLLDEPTGAGHGFIRLKTGCGHNRFVRELCSNPLCTKCEPVRAYERRRRWFPVLQAMRNPRMITLTIPDGPDLAERFNFLQQSTRRFLHMRLGERNLCHLAGLALNYAEEHYQKLVDAGEMDQAAAAAQVKRWADSLIKFIDTQTRRNDKTGKWPRLRDIIGKGFASLEITYNQDWHVHRHLCVDGGFIPWPLLCAAWRVATKDQAWVTDIREVDKSPDGMKEVAKYLTKPWEIPEDAQDEFIQAVKGLKRIWPLGGAKPVDVESVCPYCQNPECKAKLSGLANLIESGNLHGYDYRIFEMDQLTDQKRTRFVVIKRPDGVWDEVPLLDTLSVCAPLGGQSGP